MKRYEGKHEGISGDLARRTEQNGREIREGSAVEAREKDVLQGAMKKGEVQRFKSGLMTLQKPLVHGFEA